MKFAPIMLPVTAADDISISFQQDPDIREVAPKIMDILIQRLDGLYMSTAENDPQDRILRKIPPLSRRARALRTP